MLSCLRTRAVTNLFFPVHLMRLLWCFSGKESAANAEDAGSVPELGRCPGEGNGNPLQYSCWGNSMHRGAWWATVHGVHGVDLATKLQQLQHTFYSGSYFSLDLPWEVFLRLRWQEHPLEHFIRTLRIFQTFRARWYLPMALIKAVIPFATDTTKILGAKVFLDKYLSGFLVWRENDRILYFALIFSLYISYVSS